MGFLDTSRFDEIKRQQKDQIILALPLVSITSIGTAVPLLGRGYLSPNKLIKFGKWWEAPILEGRNGAILSRKNLVLSMRNFDGGAHYDPTTPDDTYTELAREGDPRIGFDSGGLIFATSAVKAEGQPIKNLNRASMRQIAWELDQSLRTIGL